jgi:cytochrome P450
MPTATVWDMVQMASPWAEDIRHRLLAALHHKHGPIFKMRFPGQPHHQVWTCDPQLVKEVLAQDGPTPITPAFDFFVTYRSQVRKDLYPRTGGLVGAHGPKWYEVGGEGGEIPSCRSGAGCNRT